MKSRVIFWLVSILLWSGGAAHAQSPLAEAGNDSVRVAFINPGYGDRGFWKDVRNTMQAAADQFGYELIVFDSDRDSKKMAESAQKAFALEPAPDYIIAVNEYQQGTRIVLEAEEREIPVIMLLNDLTKEQKNTYGRPGKELKSWKFSLTPDNERAGYDIAKSLINAARLRYEKHQPTSLCLVSIAGDRSTPASLQRLDGLDHALSRFPILREQRRLVANWSHDKAYRQMENWLGRNGCVDAVWAANDDIALGAIKALREADRTPGRDVFVGGLNWSEKGLEKVQNGQMTMTHGGHFFAGAWVMVLLHDYIAGVELFATHPEITFRMEAITPGNVAYFSQILGERDWGAIDFSRFSLANTPAASEYDFTLQRADDQ